MIQKSEEFLRVCCCRYELKEGTGCSYYWKEGTNLLPNRLSISPDSEITRVNKNGRLRNADVVGEIRGTYKKNEDSPYKQYSPYSLQSRIFSIKDYPEFLGWASIGITGKGGGITRNTEKGVLLFERVNESNILIYIFTDIPTYPENILYACTYVNYIIKKDREQ